MSEEDHCPVCSKQIYCNSPSITHVIKLTLHQYQLCGHKEIGEVFHESCYLSISSLELKELEEETIQRYLRHFK